MPILRRGFQFWAVGFLGKFVTGLLYATCRTTIVDPHEIGVAVKARRRQIIAAFWHRHLLTILRTYAHHPFCAPVSRSRDGEYITHFMERLGIRSVRGSSSRGAMNLLRSIVAAVKDGWSCAITPDGPRGPRYSVQPGFVMLARRCGLPVFPAGVAASRAWVFGSWDAFMIPKPFAKIVICVGDPMTADEFGRGADTAEACAELKRRIEQATERAEAIVRGDAEPE